MLGVHATWPAPRPSESGTFRDPPRSRSEGRYAGPAARGRRGGGGGVAAAVRFAHGSILKPTGLGPESPPNSPPMRRGRGPRLGAFGASKGGGGCTDSEPSSLGPHLRAGLGRDSDSSWVGPAILTEAADQTANDQPRRAVRQQTESDSKRPAPVRRMLDRLSHQTGPTSSSSFSGEGKRVRAPGRARAQKKPLGFKV